MYIQTKASGQKLDGSSVYAKEEVNSYTNYWAVESAASRGIECPLTKLV